MTLARARYFLSIQAHCGGGYNADSAKRVLSEMYRAHGQATVDGLIREFSLERVFGFAPGTRFAEGAGAQA